jgi:hypothetical protein
MVCAPHPVSFYGRSANRGIERVLFHHGNHPIKWVRLTGVVVAVDDYTGKKVYTLDDSSGACIECVCVAPAPTPIARPTIPGHLNQIATLSRAIETSKSTAAGSKDVKEKGDGEKGKKKEPSVEDPNVPWEQVDVGIVVKVKGRVGRNWMGLMQVEIIKMEVLGCTDMEVRCWNEVIAFRRDVLGKPWAVEKEDEEKCLKRREKELRHRRKDRKSKKSEMDKDGVRRKRKELERIERHDEEVKRQKQKEIQDEEETNRKFNARNKKNYPSLVVKRAAPGKYDALGI